MNTTRASLLIRIRDRQDAVAWGEFDRIYRPLVYRYACAQGLAHADAEDIAQDCLAAVQEQISRFDYDPQKGRFKAWLRTIVQRRVLNLRRERQVPAADVTELPNVVAADPSPEAVFERLWLEEHLRYCLSLVRDEVEDATYRAFQHYVIEEWPVERVCAALGMTPGQVHLVKWRVTGKLRARMKALMDGGE